MTFTSAPVRHLVIGEPEHAVAQYAHSLARALGDVSPTLAGSDSDVHVQFTDRLFGRTPEEAADDVERLARSHSISVTLHDVPQPSDGRLLARRAEAYRRVIATARGVVCNSRYEAALVEQHVLGRGGDSNRAGSNGCGSDGGNSDGCNSHSGARGVARVVGVPIEVIPLPVDLPPGAGAGAAVGAGPYTGSRASSAATMDARPLRRAEAALLGYFYPGKGHAEVVAAVAAARLPVTVTTLGRASNGHDDELKSVERQARRLGVAFETTGFLPKADLEARCREAAIPIAAHRHFSASASINSWISAGRRPLVPDAPYTREMAELRPETLTLYDPERPAALAEALERAWHEPHSTWLGIDAVTTPDTAAVAELYRAWWAGLP